MINNVVLVGRLTRDVDLRYTGSGTAVGNFSLAIDRPFTNNQGERDTDFINCVIWRRQAETLANFTRKGSLVGVTGRIQTRSYDNNQGQKVYVTEIVAENFQLLEPKSVTDRRIQESGTSPQTQGGGNAGGGYGQQDGFSQPNLGGANPSSNNQAPSYDSFNDFKTGPANDPFESNSDQIEISDDDLPF